MCSKDYTRLIRALTSLRKFCCYRSFTARLAAVQIRNSPVKGSGYVRCFRSLLPAQSLFMTPLIRIISAIFASR